MAPFEGSAAKKFEGEGSVYQLCPTCVHEAYCTYPHDPSRITMHCDEFEGIVLPPPKTLIEGKGWHGTAQAKSNEDDKHASEFIGLCRTCDRRHTCMFHKPEGGVWHCEEYT
jgi:hypothetical protein